MSQSLTDNLLQQDESAETITPERNADEQAAETEVQQNSRKRLRLSHKLSLLRESEATSLAKARKNSLQLTDKQSYETHQIAIKILLLEEEHAQNVLLQDDEIMQQQNLKTKQEEEILSKLTLLRKIEEANLRKINAIAEQEELKAKVLKLELEKMEK